MYLGLGLKQPVSRARGENIACSLRIVQIGSGADSVLHLGSLLVSSKGPIRNPTLLVSSNLAGGIQFLFASQETEPTNHQTLGGGIQFLSAVRATEDQLLG